MEWSVDLVFHYMGRWVFLPKLSYVDGECEVVGFDVDCLSYPHIMKKYNMQLGCLDVTKLFVLEPGKTLDNGLFLIEDDDGIRILTKFILKSTTKLMLHVYSHNDVNLPHCHISGLLGDTGTQNNPSTRVKDLVAYTVYGGFEASMRFDLGDAENEFIDVDITEGEEHIGLDKGKLPVHIEVEDLSTDIESEEMDDDEDPSDSDNTPRDNFAMTQGMKKIRHDVDDPRPYFMLGMTFMDANEARDAISRYSVAKGYDLKLRPNEPCRIRAKCKGDECPFELFISKDGKDGGLILKKLVPDHECYRVFKNSLATSNFLAKHFKDKLCNNPSTRVKDLVSEAEVALKLNVSHSKCKRAKKMVMNELDGSYKSEFGYLAAYAAAIARANPCNTAEIDLCKEGLKQKKRIFRRMFICFDALKKGWKDGCRPIIGLDGCFLKGVVRGQVLVAVGKDAHDQIYPIAWAVVDKENKVNWSWFLQWLKVELQLEFGSTLTLISDMQKGLLQAVKDELPAAEHRWCARHVEANWSKKWHGDELKKRFWICAWSSFQEDFCDNLKKLGEVSEKAAEDLMKYPPQAWSRAFISSRCKSNCVDNNLCESFNSTILEARHKPIVSMLEDIRRGAMERIAKRKGSVDKWRSEWRPSCMDTFHDNKKEAFGSTVLFNGAQGYEISDGDDTHTVYIDKQLCTCRVWDTTGIPCPHAIKVLEYSKVEPLSQVSRWYHKSAYIATYQYAMEHMPGKKFMNCDAYEPIEPPPITKMSGRPRKKRIRAETESQRGQRSGKLSRKCVIITCENCNVEGHNKKSCPLPKPMENIASAKAGTSAERENGTSTNLQRESSQVIIASACASKKNGKSTKSSQKGSKEKFAKIPTGFGIYIDAQSGSITENPGLRSERVVFEPQAESCGDVDMFRLVIPNEKELRQSKRDLKTQSSSGSRRIEFVGDGLQNLLPTQVPFKAPGLQWHGQPCVTSKQFQEKKQKNDKQTSEVNGYSKSVM